MFFSCSGYRRVLHSFPTRRSSDLGVLGVKLRFERDPLESTMKAVSSGTTLINHTIKNEIGKIAISTENLKRANPDMDKDRKSTRLNSSHVRISYAVFCLKKKKKQA